ncbi:MAG: SEC-C metal-binding domain-containing protein [Cellvibrionales bacterium]
MMESTTFASNETLDDNHACCSDKSCCPPQRPVTRIEPKIGRNDACPCGTGRKFKKCCGQR